MTSVTQAVFSLSLSELRCDEFGRKKWSEFCRHSSFGNWIDGAKEGIVRTYAVCSMQQCTFRCRGICIQLCWREYPDWFCDARATFFTFSEVTSLNLCSRFSVWKGDLCTCTHLQSTSTFSGCEKYICFHDYLQFRTNWSDETPTHFLAIVRVAQGREKIAYVTNVAISHATHMPWSQNFVNF